MSSVRVIFVRASAAAAVTIRRSLRVVCSPTVRPSSSPSTVLRLRDIDTNSLTVVRVSFTSPTWTFVMVSKCVDKTHRPPRFVCVSRPDTVLPTLAQVHHSARRPTRRCAIVGVAPVSANHASVVPVTRLRYFIYDYNIYFHTMILNLLLIVYIRRVAISNNENSFLAPTVVTLIS